MSSASTLARSWSITLILSPTLAPPRIARYGRGGPLSSGCRCFSSDASRKPAPRWARCLTIPTVGAGARALRELARELVVVLLLLGVEAQVLEQQHLPVLELADELLHAVAHAVV